MPPEGALVAVKETAEIGMLPTAEVPAASVEQGTSAGDVVILPFPLRQHDLTGVDQALRVEKLPFELLAGGFELFRPALGPDPLGYGKPCRPRQAQENCHCERRAQRRRHWTAPHEL